MNKFYKFNFLCNEDGGEGGEGGGGTTPTPPPTSIINGDFTFAENWNEKFGDDAKGLTFKSMPDLLKSYKSSVTKISELGQKVKELGGAEGQAIPADTAGYKAEIKLPEQMPEGVYVPDGLLDAAAKYGIENKIPPSVTQKFVEFQIAQAGKEAESFKSQQFAAVENAKAEIAKQVGKENFDVTISNAKAAHDLLGLQLSEADLMQNPSLVVSLAKIHTKISPAQLKDLNLSVEGQSAQGKLQQAEDIAGNSSNPDYEAFNDPTHLNHDAVMAKFNRLIVESGSR